MRKKEELDLYIDNHIMNQVNYKRKINPDTLEEYYEATYQLHTLFDKTTIEEDEIEYVFNRLNEKGVIVTGNSPVLYGDFPNYRYVLKPRYSKQKELFDKDRFNELMVEFKTMKIETKKDEEKYNLLRKKIITMNARYVDYIVAAFNYNGKFDLDELASFGYEGLIKAVDNFDYTKGKFSIFAKKYVQGYIMRGIQNIKGFSSTNFYCKYLDVKESLEKELGETIDDDFEHLDEIAERIFNKDILPHDSKEEVKTRLSLLDVLSLDELGDYFYDDNSLYKEVIENENKKSLKQDIDIALSILTDRQREILVKIYGLDGNEPKDYKQVAEESGSSIYNIYGLVKKSIEKLRYIHGNSKKLRDYNYSINEYDYNPTGIEVVKVKK